MLATLKLAGYLQSKKKVYHAQGDAFTSFADLQNGPTVLIGGFNNSWSMRYMSQTHFSFVSSGSVYCIVDRSAPSRKDWCQDSSKPYSQYPEDEALISRFLDPSTSQWVVIVSGNTLFGTIAAGDFLSDPKYMDLTSRAPRDWDQKNIQIVIAARVMDGATGPPRIIATYFW